MQETNEFGQVFFGTNTYHELETGMHYRSGGEWQETRAEIELLADGAAATNGPHKVFFAANLNTVGAISLTTPQGQLLRSRVFGLSYFDAASGKVVLIAETRDSIGQLIYPNQVIYTNAFDDVVADVQYFYTKAGFEQNIVFRKPPPAPAEWGLNPKTTRLQVLTEFFDPPAPERRVVAARRGNALSDEALVFGQMRIGAGKAFAVGEANEAKSPVQVYKQWLLLAERTFLVEEVPFDKVEQQLNALSQKRQAGTVTPRRAGQGENFMAALSTVLPRRTAQSAAGVIRMAKATGPRPPGYVLDYSIVSGATNFTFRGDTTYYVSGTVNLEGITKFEGGTVVKYATNAAVILVGDAHNIATTSGSGDYRPVILTAKDDDSVGDPIAGSTGSPTNYYANPAVLFSHAGTEGMKNFHVRYAKVGFAMDSDFYDFPFYDLQLVHCAKAFEPQYAMLHVRNGLLFDITDTAFDAGSYSLRLENVTIHQCNRLAQVADLSDFYALYNCLLVGVTNWGNVSFTTNSTVINQDETAFQTAGAGAHYLAVNSTNRNAGTTNINTSLLAALKHKTTYPPIVLSNLSLSASTNLVPQAQRGGDVPDLGYHYDPIDYLTCWFTVSNATLTVSNGTAIACYYDTGIWIADGSSIVSIGTPLAPNWFTRHSLVQEQPVAFGTGPAAAINSFHYADRGPSGTFRFSRFSCPAGANDYHLYHIDFSGEDRFAFDQLLVRDCEFWNGMNYFTGARTNAGPVTVNNNLFHRSRLWAYNATAPQSLSLSNNLAFGMNLAFYGPNSDLWKIYDNAFDTCTFILASQPITNGNNAYINCANRLSPTNASDVVLTNFSYEAGPLGNYHQPTNSPLLNAGSVTNAGLVDLYHYTVTTDQVKEAVSRVDIGLHYVTVGTNNVPLDSDADGVPDYLDADSDGDGLADAWEIKYFGNLNQTAAGDPDSDGLSNLDELQLGTSPTNWDTDGDGLSDSEELEIPIDVNHPEWGHLDPLKPRSGRANVTDDKLDGDHDGLSNLAELRHYHSDPANPHTYSEGLNDAEYFHVARVEASGQPPLPPAYQAFARGLQVNLGGGLLQFSISEAEAGARYDLYFVNNISSARWQWRRVFSGIECDANGDATFTLQQPDPYQGYFVLLDAADSDGDGLTDGYETWFTYNGLKTEVDVNDSDDDGLKDGWEVAYGLNPTPSGGTGDGPAGNPDGDGFTNQEEHDNSAGYPVLGPSYDPLKVYNTAANRTVVVIYNTTTNPDCAEASFTIYRYVGDGGNLNGNLKVYYSVGGSLRYGTDYTLSPAPPDLPRIYSAVIPDGEQSVTVTATLIGNAVPAGSKKLVATITPYSVSPTTQVLDPVDWAYVVDWNYNRAEVTFDFENLRPHAYDQSVKACPNADNPITLSGYAGCGDALTYAVLSSPAHGTLTGTAPNLTYHPSLNYLGPDGFTFKVNDGLRDSAIATVSINVDNQPAADSQSVQTCRNTEKLIELTGSGRCNQPLTFTVVTSPAHGMLTGTAPNLTYQPGLDFEGSDSFTFKANNGLQDSTTATVYIEVGYQPVADSQLRVTDLSRPIGITLSGSDQCSDPLTFSIVTSPALGSLSGTTPNMTYTPASAGEDSFTFKVNDSVRDSGDATVSVVVLPAPAVTTDCRPRSILLAWNLPAWAIGYANNFVVYRSTTPGGAYPSGDIIATVTRPTLSHIDLNVTPGTTYYYVVGFQYTDPGTASSFQVVSEEVSSSTCCPPSTEFWTDYGPTPQQLAQWIMGAGATVNNAAFTGASVARGIFGGGTSAGLPISQGVILSSGDIALAKGPNDQPGAGKDNGLVEGDTDLNALANGLSTRDAAVLEFDFSSTSTNVTLQFLFASEEYHFYIASFNDIMAIWVDGLNIALVPNTTEPVAVNTIHDGYAPHSIAPSHPEFFVNNENPPALNIQFNGLTTLLTAHATVSASVSHHVKIAVADANDGVLDSAVFINATVPCQ